MYYENTHFHACPFGNGAEKWRQFYSVEYIVDGKAAEMCSCNGETHLLDLKNHLDSFIGKFGLHEAAMDYLRYCEEHLPEVAQYVVVKDGEGITIRSVQSPALKNEREKRRIVG